MVYIPSIGHPNIGLADFSESARWHASLEALSSDTREGRLSSIKHIRTSRSFVAISSKPQTRDQQFAASSRRRVLLAGRHCFPIVVVAHHRRLRRDRSSRWDHDLDSSFQNFLRFTVCDAESPLTFCRNSVRTIDSIMRTCNNESYL